MTTETLRSSNSGVKVQPDRGDGGNPHAEVPDGTRVLSGRIFMDLCPLCIKELNVHMTATLKDAAGEGGATDAGNMYKITQLEGNTFLKLR